MSEVTHVKREFTWRGLGAVVLAVLGTASAMAFIRLDTRVDRGDGSPVSHPFVYTAVVVAVLPLVFLAAAAVTSILAPEKGWSRPLLRIALVCSGLFLLPAVLVLCDIIVLLPFQ